MRIIRHYQPTGLLCHFVYYVVCDFKDPVIRRCLILLVKALLETLDYYHSISCIIMNCLFVLNNGLFLKLSQSHHYGDENALALKAILCAQRLALSYFSRVFLIYLDSNNNTLGLLRESLDFSALP